MKMLIIGLLLLSLGFAFSPSSTAASAAQTKPDFSGIWKIDMSASDFGGRKSTPAYDELMLVISHHDPELKITRKIIKKKRERLQELLYFTDGRGESNPGLDGKTTIKSKTKWDGSNLTSKGSTSITISGASLTIEFTDKWLMSPDSKTLIHTTLANSGTSRRVFRRIS